MLGIESVQELTDINSSTITPVPDEGADFLGFVEADSPQLVIQSIH